MTEKGEGTEREKEVCREKRVCPARGKRYSPAQKQEILEYAVAHDVQAAAERFQVTEASIYEWRRCLKRRGVADASDKEGGKIVIEDSKAERDRKILAMWRQHPGYGPSQIRNMLKRGGFKVSVGTDIGDVANLYNLRYVCCMVRQARLDAPGVLHHVMARGIERQPIFIDDRDRDEFVRRLSDLALEGKLIVYAWSLMPNHFHLLVRTGKISLSRSMRSLLTGYAGYFNRRHRRHGHVFQSRFKSIICEEEPYFLELVRYLHLNPLRAGVVKDLKGLDRYPYTGHSVLVGRIDRSWQDTEDVWSRFGGTCREAAKSYRAFISDGVGQGRRPDLMGGGLYRSMGGWRAVADLRRGREAYRSDERVLGSSAFVEALLEEADAQLKGRYRQVELSKLKKRIAKDMGVSSHALSGGGRSENVSRARAVLCYVWVHYLGQSGRVLAEELGVSPQAVYAASSRMERDGGLDAEALERWCQ